MVVGRCPLQMRTIEVMCPTRVSRVSNEHNYPNGPSRHILTFKLIWPLQHCNNELRDKSYKSILFGKRNFGKDCLLCKQSH